MTESLDWEAQLRELEESHLALEVRRSRAALEELLDDDFYEVGRSGRTYDKAQVIEALLETPALPDSLRVEDFRAHALARDVALTTYTTRAGEHAARRSSIWVRRDGRWQLRYHQGTPAAERDG